MKNLISYGVGLFMIIYCLHGIYLNIQSNKPDGIIFFIVLLLVFFMFWIPIVYYKSRYPDDE